MLAAFYVSIRKKLYSEHAGPNLGFESSLKMFVFNPAHCWDIWLESLRIGVLHLHIFLWVEWKQEAFQVPYDETSWWSLAQYPHLGF